METTVGTLPCVKSDGAGVAEAVGVNVAEGGGTCVAVLEKLGVAVAVPVAETVDAVKGVVDCIVAVAVAVAVTVAESAPSAMGEGGTGVSAKIGVWPAGAT